MGTISSGSGLISGLDIAGLVSQLMQIEARPLALLNSRIEETGQQKLAYQTLSAQLMSALSSITRLSQSSAFTVRSAVSSQPDALSAVAESSAPLGTYSFLVRSVVSTHQMASLGFADRDVTPVGAGTLTFESAQARVDTDTELAVLNGGSGVRRGQIRITDRSGASVTVDLRSAYSVGDVLEAINSQTQAAVRAYVDEDRIVIEDITGLDSSQGQLTVSNVGAGLTATDLGIAGPETGSGRITSAHDLIRLTAASSLSFLNDGLGVRFNETQPDLRFTLANGRVFEVNLTNAFGLRTSLAELNGGQGVGPGTIRITNKLGVSREIQLTGTETLNDIKAILASPDNADLEVSITSVSSSGNIIFSDSSGGDGSFKIEDVTGTIAAQLKLAGETEGDSLTGHASYQFNTIEALIRRIQYARDSSPEANLNNGDFEIAIAEDGKGLVVIDHTAGGSSTSVEELNGSHALWDLGLTGNFSNGALAGSRLISGLNTVLLRNLNGGSGVRLGVAQFQLRDGTSRTVDFTGAQTLQDVINRINDQDSLRAEVASGGMGLVVTDETTGTGEFAASGDTVEDLHLTGAANNGRLTGGDLNRKYIAENTLLASLNGGGGIGLTAGDSNSVVRFQITNTAGESAVISLSGSIHKTVGDVIEAINEAMADKGVRARINEAGDGIELYEESPAGTGRLKVSEVSGGTAAAALHLEGEAPAGDIGRLNGSFAGTVEIGPADTLDDVVAKINSAGLGVQASILSDGSGSRPYRLVITSRTAGTAGRIGYAGDGTSLSFQTLNEAQDARVVVGNIDSPNAIVISSSSNTITGVVQGLTLNLLAPSDTPVQVSVSQDVDSVVNDLKSFITAYNATLSRIDELTKFVPETLERGPLLGDAAVLQIQSRLYRQVSRSLPAGHSFNRLTSVGISFGSGGRLELDEEAFRDAMAADPEAVTDLFTEVTTTENAAGEEKVSYVGIAASLKEELRKLTSSSDGLLNIQTDRLDERIELYNRRAAEMQELLDRKEARYYAQFQAMEQALAQLQAQQSALAALANMVNSYSPLTGG